MSVRVAPSPHLWSVVKKMHLKTGKGPGARHRPDTATLEKPLILDPGLLRKVDMTRLTRDQLMTIENLIVTPKKTRNSQKVKEKSGKTATKSGSREERIDGWEDDESSTVEDLNENRKFIKNSRVNNTTFRVRSHVRKGLREVFDSPCQVSSPARKEAKAKNSKETNHTKEKNSVEDVFGTLILSDHLVPSPCSTCGRSERPERLHAHPSVPQHKRSKLKEDQENTVVKVAVQQKSSVTKPVAMKFRSGKTREKHPVGERPIADQLKVQKEKERKSVPLIRRETFRIERSSKPVLSVEKKTTPSPSPTRKSSILINPPPRRQALPRTPEKPPAVRAVSPMPPPLPMPTNPPVVHSASPRRPRTITCYLCHKQFGTASYPLHEPQCLQKWNRENQALPAAQQQPEPQRPGGHAPFDLAWEAAQAAMVACDRCSKTFLPSRLDAHQRVCPAPHTPVKKPTPAPPKQLQECENAWEDRSERSVLLEGPTSIHCHICGRIFNKAAIDHHEQQCLKRWQLEHSSRDSSSSAAASPASSPPSSAQSTPQRRRLVLCYLCGRQFGSTSITIHEPQCLRKWRQENERLPPAQRRPEPQKPDLVYNSETGQVDHQATEEAQWKCHLVQLVPCNKCGRTFNPDRVQVHEKCCKGPQQKH